MQMTNPKIVLVLAPFNSGKTYCLKNAGAITKAFHINCDAKPLPFKAVNIHSAVPNSVKEIPEFIRQAEAAENIGTIIIDTFTQLGASYTSNYVDGADDTRKAWGEYKVFLDKLIEQIKKGTKTYIILAHEDSFIEEGTGITRYKAPFQGGFAKIGLEAHFSTILGATKIRLSTLEESDMNDCLNITEDEKEDDSKYVFRTRIDGTTLGAGYRTPAGMFTRNERFIDNDIAIVLERINEYYS